MGNILVGEARGNLGGIYMFGFLRSACVWVEKIDLVEKGVLVVVTWDRLDRLE